MQTTLDSMSDDLASVQQEQATMQTEQAAKDAAQDESIAACALKTEIPTVVNDLSTGGETAALSAEQGKTLLGGVENVLRNRTCATFYRKIKKRGKRPFSSCQRRTLPIQISFVVPR